MREQELGGNIVLVNFNFDNQEMIIAKKIIGNYAMKIRQVSDYRELKVEMKIHKKAKLKQYEFKVLGVFEGFNASSEIQGFNAFVVLDEVMKKILAETKHKMRKEDIHK